MNHSIVKTGDPDVFPAILDRNNEVVLSYCRRCRDGEGSLESECPFFECKGCFKVLPLTSECHSDLCHECSDCSNFLENI